MKIAALNPPCADKVKFDYSGVRYVPAEAGCYALSTHTGKILYVGKATSLQKRMSDHLGDSKKTSPTKFGTAFYFHFLVVRPSGFLDILGHTLTSIEQGWAQQHFDIEGRLPVFNEVFPS